MDFIDELHHYGTALPRIEKDVPAKKPVHIEDQIVTDENGKRRFHGAFTGGFSAGYWNTVGSEEGWTPQTFKSSRKNRATERQERRPEDYMDTEDLGEFGIAPRVIRPKDEFRRAPESDALNFVTRAATTIEELLRPALDKTALQILKKMGWKPAQEGKCATEVKTAPKVDKKRALQQYLMEKYGCMEEDGLAPVREEPQIDVVEAQDETADFTTMDYEPIMFNIKTNRYGLHYVALSRESILSAKKSTPTANKPHSKGITGQAFGVGVLEEEDEDIYALEDATQYDFSMEKNRAKAEKRVTKESMGDFVEGPSDCDSLAVYRVDVPRDFVPRNWTKRKSRFDVVDSSRNYAINPDVRGAMLGQPKPAIVEEPPPVCHIKGNPFADRNMPPSGRASLFSEKPTPKTAAVNVVKDQPLLASLAAITDRFVRSSACSADEKPEATKPEEVVIKKENKKPVIMERTTVKWVPTKQLCKRYNIAGAIEDVSTDHSRMHAQKSKISIFSFIQGESIGGTETKAQSGISKEVDDNAAHFATTMPASAKSEAIKPQHSTEEHINKPVSTSIDSRVTTNFGNQASSTFIAPAEPTIKPCPEVKEPDSQPISEKLDLFQSIFGDSDDDATSDEPILEAKPKEDIAQIRKKLRLSITEESKPIEKLNAVQNNAPPQGIFATLFQKPAKPFTADASTAALKPVFNAPSINTKKPPAALPDDDDVDDQPAEIYGPMPPRNISLINSSSMLASKSANTLNVGGYSKPPSPAPSSEVWIEKKSSGHKKSKKHKDHKDHDSRKSHSSKKHKKKSKKEKK